MNEDRMYWALGRTQRPVGIWLSAVDLGAVFVVYWRR